MLFALELYVPGVSPGMVASATVDDDDPSYVPPLDHTNPPPTESCGSFMVIGD